MPKDTGHFPWYHLCGDQRCEKHIKDERYYWSENMHSWMMKERIWEDIIKRGAEK